MINGNARRQPPMGLSLRALASWGWGRVAIIAVVLAGIAPAALSADAPAADAGQGRKTVRILLDSIHAHNNLEPLPEDGTYEYHRYTAHQRVFTYLRSRGVEVTEAKTGRIDAAALKGQSMLYINLVSAELPPFRRNEIDAIRSFVEGGGGLVVISDHTNCYYHSYKLMPLLDELGIETHNEAACDRNENILSTGHAWVSVTRFSEHPVTRGLRRIAYQCGGTVDDRFAIGRLSPKGWGDLWSFHPYADGDTPGNYGDFIQQPTERAGQLGVLLAREFGKGRIVIVADHNCFTNYFINYADNYRLFLNAVGWCSGEEALADPEPYHRWRGPRILAYEDPARASFGLRGPAGTYHVFDYLSRKYPIFATDDLTGEAGAMLFSHGERALPKPQLDALVAHLKRGRFAVILNPDAKGGGIVQQLTRVLGKPEVGADADTLWYHWPGGGRVTQVIDRDGIDNQTIPSYKAEADLAQRRRLALLSRLLALNP